MRRSIAEVSRHVSRNFGVATEKVQWPQTRGLNISNSLSKPSLYRSSRFHSLTSSPNASDGSSFSPETELYSYVFGENEYPQMENSKFFREYVDTQIGNFVPREAEEGEVYEIDVDKLENVLSPLESSVDCSLESSLDSLDLDLRENSRGLTLKYSCKGGKNVLVKAICSRIRKKNVWGLWGLIKEIGEKESGVLTVEILNELIASFTKLGKGKAAFEVFSKFGDYGCVENQDTFYFTMEALCRCKKFYLAWFVCEKMIETGSLPDGVKVGKIISWFCKGGKAKEAHLVFKLAKEKNKSLPQYPVNFLISSLCQSDETVKLALDMLDDFSDEARKHAFRPFSSVICSLCRMKDVDGAKRWLSRMIFEGPPPGNYLFNSVISAYCKAGDMKPAMETMKLMEVTGSKADVYTYTILMSGYAHGGQMEEACEILNEAKKNHSRLSPVAYHRLITGYCKLKEFDKASELLNEMVDVQVEPTVDRYTKLIQSLSLRASDWRTAEKLSEEMKLKGLHLNGITRALIRAVKKLEEEGVKNDEALVEA